MGDFIKKLSDRQKHVKLNGGKGYCIICNAYERLTFDHVPPKAAKPFLEVDQFHVMETYNPTDQIKGINSSNGSKFRTICKGCNSLIGRYDKDLGDLCNDVVIGVKQYFKSASYISTKMFFKCSPLAVMRAVVGHMISAASTLECESAQVSAPFWDTLKSFALEGRDPSDTHDFYCWFYPYKNSISAKNVGFSNEGHVSVLTVLSFYPVAFLVVQKNTGIYPAQAHKIRLDSKGITLDLSSRGFESSRFPFHRLTNNQFLLLNDAMCIVSMPTQNN